MYFNGWCKMHFWASKWQDSKELCTAWLVESGIGFAVSISRNPLTQPQIISLSQQSAYRTTVIDKTGKTAVLLRSSSCSDGFVVVCWSCQFKMHVGYPDLSLGYFLFKYVEKLGDFV